MSTIVTKFTRYCGWLAVLAGLLLLSAEFVGSVFLDQQVRSINTLERIDAALFFAGAVALTVALVGIYLSQAEAAGTFGVAAFLVALAGSAMMSCSDWNELFAGPALMQVPNFEKEFPVMLIAGFQLNYGVYILGWVLFGIATYRARVFPRGVALLMLAGILVSFIRLPGVFAPFYGTFLWIGVLMLRRRPAIEPQMPTAVAATSG